MSKTKVRNPQLLRDYLNNLTVDELRRLNGFFPHSLATRKEDRVQVIHQGMMTGDGLTRLWERLDTLQKAAVSEVVHSPSNRFVAGPFRAKYGGDPYWGTSESWGSISQPSVLGLFFYDYEMPVDLKAALKAFVPQPTGVKLKTLDSLPEQVSLTLHAWQERRGQTADMVDLTICETQRLAQHDLLAVLRLVEAGQVKITAKTQRPTAATLRAVAEVLEGGDYYPAPDLDKTSAYFGPTQPELMRSFAWPLLILSANLAEAAGNKLQLTSNGKAALTAPAHQTLRKVWTSWLKNKLLDEFNRVTKIKGQTGRGAADMTAPGPRRKAIADALAELPPNRWLEFDEFSRYMQAAGHNFTISRDFWTLYVEDANYGSLGYSGFHDWHIVQARYLLVFLMEYAATLGLIDIAYIPPVKARLDFGNLWGIDDFDCLSDYDGLRYLRLNNFGAWCLGLNADYQPPVVQAQQLFNVLPNHDLVVMGALPASDRLMLARFAQQTAERVWHIDPALLLDAHEAGFPIGEIRTYLAAKSGTALPQTVAALFQEMAEKIARLTQMENAHLIEVRDAHTRQILVSESRLAKFCLPAGERHIAVPAQALSAFRRALHELGYALPEQNK